VSRFSTAGFGFPLLAAASIGGGGIGFCIGLATSLPSAFALWIAPVGAVIGAISGLASMFAGLLAYQLTRNLHSDKARWGIVAGLAAIGAAATSCVLLTMGNAAYVVPLVVISFVVSALAAVIVYPGLHRKCSSAPV
jgi:hypothetical protein